MIVNKDYNTGIVSFRPNSKPTLSELYTNGIKENKTHRAIRTNWKERIRNKLMRRKS